MSNRKKWSKRIKFKHQLKKDNVFKSYWIRKFLNKITNVSKLQKCEYFMYNSFLNIKNLQLKKFNSKNLKKYKTKFYNFKKIKFRNFRYKYVAFNYKYVTYSYIIKKKRKLIYFFFWKNREIYFQNFRKWGPKDFSSKYKMGLLLKENISLFKFSKKFNIYGHFLKTIKRNLLEIYNDKENNFPDRLIPYLLNNVLFFKKKKSKMHSPVWKTIHWNSLETIKTSISPIKYFFFILDSVRWVFTTQLRRMGKYFHNIPTVIRFPRSYNHGLKRFAFSLKQSRKYYSFSKRLDSEFLNLLFSPRKSMSYKQRREKLKIVFKNSPYSNFRWK